MTQDNDRLLEVKATIRKLLYQNPRTSLDDVVIAWMDEATDRIDALTDTQSRLVEGLKTAAWRFSCLGNIFTASGDLQGLAPVMAEAANDIDTLLQSVKENRE